MVVGSSFVYQVLIMTQLTYTVCHGQRTPLLGVNGGGRSLGSKDTEPGKGFPRNHDQRVLAMAHIAIFTECQAWAEASSSDSRVAQWHHVFPPFFGKENSTKQGCRFFFPMATGHPSIPLRLTPRVRLGPPVVPFYQLFWLGGFPS